MVFEGIATVNDLRLVPPRTPLWSVEAEQERNTRSRRAGELALRALAKVEEQEAHGDTYDEREGQEQSVQPPPPPPSDDPADTRGADGRRGW